MESQYSYETLSKEWGLNTPLNYSWEIALIRITESDRNYIKHILRSGHELDEKPNIKLSTIHGAKGGESQNVILFSDISKRINDNMWANRDDERRGKNYKTPIHQQCNHLIKSCMQHYQQDQ